MFREWHQASQDMTLRLGGILSIAAGVLATRTLLASVDLPPRHGASATEMALAAVAFLCLSGGALLALLGRHIFDRVQLSARWAGSSGSRSGSASPTDDELMARFAPDVFMDRKAAMRGTSRISRPGTIAG